MKRFEVSHIDFINVIVFIKHAKECTKGKIKLLLYLETNRIIILLIQTIPFIIYYIFIIYIIIIKNFWFVHVTIQPMRNKIHNG